MGKRGEASLLLIVIAAIILPVLLLGGSLVGYAQTRDAPLAKSGSGTYTNVRATGYVPNDDSRPYLYNGTKCDAALGGGKNDKASSLVYTIPEYFSGKSSWVTVAMDSAVYNSYPYGSKLRIPEIEKMYGGRQINFELRDTGGHFSGGGLGFTAIDIAIDCQTLKTWNNPTVTLIFEGGANSTAGLTNTGGSYTPSRGTNGVPYFNQGDPKYGSQRIYTDSRPFRQWGCCPTSLAMILRYYDKPVDPIVVGKLIIAKGDYHGNGTEHQAFPDVAKAYNLTYKEINLETAKQYLQQGKPILSRGKGSNPYSPGGHCVVFVSYDQYSNTFMVNNPSRNHGGGPFTEAQIRKTSNATFYYIGP